MISLYKKTETDFSHNGITLMPTVCTVHEVAGGAYELHMEHPFDEQERYKELFEDMIIQAPVPPFHREQITMPDVKVYLVNADNTPLYTKLPYYQRMKDEDIEAVKSSPDSYAWSSTKIYNPGALVTKDGKIYRALKMTCVAPAPGTNPSIWGYVTTVDGAYGVQKAGEYTDTLASGTRVFKLGDASGGYMRVRVIVGSASKEGWVELGKLTETSDTESGKVYPAKDIDKQLFRIYNVTSEDDLGTVVVEARHISYDFASNCLYECELKDATAADAISMIQGTLIDKEEPDERTIATNIVTGERISEDWSFRNPVNALLGQDDGLVPLTDAKLLRDNKDFFILDNTLYLNEKDASAGIMEGYFKLGNVALLSRPKISAADMVSAGWTGVENGQTVYTQNYRAAPEGSGQSRQWGQNIIINITPICSAERVLSPAELDAYVTNLLTKKSASEILARDAEDKPTGSNLVLWIQSGFETEKWQDNIDKGALFRELLRKLQRCYYYDRPDQLPSLSALQSFDPSITCNFAESKITLEYGANLTGVQWGRNVENVITRIVPRSHLANDGWLYLDEVYVDSEHINDYPFHRIETMDCGYTVGQEREKPDGTKAKWTEDEVKEQMRQDARDRFTKQHVDSVTISLSVEFLLLGDSEEYKQFRGLQRLNLYDLVTVDARRSGIIHMAQVTEYEYDCILGRYNSVKVGTVNKFSRRRGGRLSYGSYTPELAALITSAGVDMSDGNDEGYKPNGGAVDPIMTPVIDDLTHTDTTKALSANMGKYLNDNKIDTSEKGANGGVAELDNAGKVPSSQLPSYVDDVLEYATKSSFPATGESGKIYVAQDTNLTYRWTGSAYIEISPSLALGETSSTAYRGDRGKAAYDHATAKGSAFASGLYKITTNAEGHVTAATAVAKSDITALGIPGQDTNTWKANSSNSEGYVASGSGQANKVWKTNASGEPAWRDDANTTYSEATSSAYGLIKIGYSENNKKYAVQLSGGKAYVEVPWTDTTYSDMTGASSGAAGAHGLVPAPAAGKHGSFLRGDGSWATPAGTYSLPLAASGTRGGVQIGYTTDGTNRNYAVQLSGEKMYVNVPWTDTTYTLPLAASGTRGGIKIGFTQTDKKYPVQLSSEKAYVEVPWTDTTYSDMTAASASAAGTHGLVPAPAAGKQGSFLRGDGTWATPAGTYSLPLAANGTRGGVQIGYTQNGKNYPVQLSSEKMYVNVPWENTTYNAGTGISLIGDRFYINTNYTTNGNNYKVSTDQNGDLYVTVPWTDTTYSAGTGISISGTTITNDLNAAINALSTGDANSQVGDYLISQYANGGTTTKTYHRRPVSKVVNKTVVNAALGTSSTHGGAFYRKDGTWVVPTDTNTTYTIAAGDSNGQIKVTPSSGSAYNVSVKGLGSAAYTASTAYAPSDHYHEYIFKRSSLVKGTNPSSTTWGLFSSFYESGTGTTDANRLFAFGGRVAANGETAMELIAYKNEAGSSVVNGLGPTIMPDGTMDYIVTSPAAFRNRISAVSKAGDTMTGSLISKFTAIDASKANNNVTSTQYPTTFSITDTAGRIISRVESKVESGGNISTQLYVRNYNTSGEQLGQGGITMTMSKAGVLTYSVSTPANFRSAISAFATTGGTLYNSGTDTPLYVKSKTDTAYIGFKASDDTVNGFLYITKTQKAGLWYSSTPHHFALEADAVKSISRSGTTFTATRCDGTTFTFTQQDNNTWRPVQDNLTSTSTSDCLSAYQGNLLANGMARDGRLVRINLAAGKTLTIGVTAENVPVIVVWRTGTSANAGIMFTVAGHNTVNLVQTGADYCQVGYISTGTPLKITVKNNSTEYMRGFVIVNADTTFTPTVT